MRQGRAPDLPRVSRQQRLGELPLRLKGFLHGRLHSFLYDPAVAVRVTEVGEGDARLPGRMLVIPVPITIDAAEPGGVSWTTRMPGMYSTSWSRTKPSRSV